MLFASPVILVDEILKIFARAKTAAELKARLEAAHKAH